MAARPLVIAHRGARDIAPENTLAAFWAAKSVRADGIECDVSRCKTGEIIVIHDDTVDRTTNGQGSLNDLSFDELRELDAGAWFAPRFAGQKLPTLLELIRLVWRSLSINIEIKGDSAEDDGIEREIAQVVHDFRIEKTAIISSFNPWALKRMNLAAPEINCGLLYANAWPHQPNLETVLAETKLTALHPEFNLVDQGYVTWAHQQGYRVNVWTVNEPDDMLRMVNLGVDGIITDHPGLLRNLLEERGF